MNEKWDDEITLPEKWGRHMRQRTKQDNCNVCDSPFSMVAVFGIGNRDFFCKSCGYAVCDTCSKTKKRLSKDDKTEFRICDLCATKLENTQLNLIFDRIEALRNDKEKLLKDLVLKLKTEKAKLQKEIDAD